jgi:hypothetical protein
VDKQLKLLECLAYFEENKPSPEVLERFGQTIADWNILHPLYCEQADTLSGFHELAFTLAIAHDLSEESMNGFEERYCFEDPLVAMEELMNWHKRQYNDMRPAGWVAVRKISSMKAFKASYEEHYSPTYAQELLQFANSDSRPTATHAAILENREQIKEEVGYDDNKIKHLASYLMYTNQVE